MTTNSCHVRIGDIAWCQCDATRYPTLYAEARKRSIDITCGQTSGANAVALVHMLQDLGAKDASVADGLCEWDPASRDLSYLTKRRRATSPA